MTTAIRLSDEEIEELELLLHRELDSTRVELRRTRNPQFRDGIKHYMRVTEHMLEVVEGARAGAEMSDQTA